MSSAILLGFSFCSKEGIQRKQECSRRQQNHRRVNAQRMAAQDSHPLTGLWREQEIAICWVRPRRLGGSFVIALHFVLITLINKWIVTFTCCPYPAAPWQATVETSLFFLLHINSMWINAVIEPSKEQTVLGCVNSSRGNRQFGALAKVSKLSFTEVHL